MRVCHAACCDELRLLAEDARRRPARAYDVEDLRRAVLRAVVGHEDEVDAGVEVVVEVLSRMSSSSRTRRVMTSFIEGKLAGAGATTGG